MVHTLPDYTTKYKMTKIFGTVDDAELAARLGSPNTYDRRGQTIWMDDFENTPINWFTDGIGAGHTETLSNTRSWRGSQSLKLTTGAVANNDSQIKKTFSAPISTTLGLEMHLYTSDAPSLLKIYFYGYTGTRVYRALVKWDPNAYTISYANSADADVNLSPEVTWLPASEHWIPIKIVIDWDKLEYKRILAGANEYDLTGQPLWSAADATRPNVNIWLYWYTQVNVAHSLYIDNVILTQNEP